MADQLSSGPQKFKFVGGAGTKGVDELPELGIENLGKMSLAEWSRAVANSAVVMGVGAPPLSPTREPT